MRRVGAPAAFDRLLLDASVGSDGRHARERIAVVLERADDLLLAVESGDPARAADAASRYRGVVERAEQAAGVPRRRRV